MDELLQQFLIEGRELVADAHAALALLRREPRDMSALDALFRATHTLKGSVALFDMEPAEQLLHAAENRLARARTDEVPLDMPSCDALVATIDQTDRWIDALAANGVLAPEAARIAVQLSEPLAMGGEEAEPDGKTSASTDPRWLDALRLRPEFSGQLEGAATAFRYRPDADCFFRGEDPLAVVAAVPALAAIAIGRDGEWPALAAHDPFRCIAWIEGISGADADAVRAVFRLVPDQVEIAALDARDTSIAIGGEGDAKAASLRVDANKLDRLARQSGELTVALHGLHGLAAGVERLDRALGAELRRVEAAIAQANTALRASVTDIRLVSLSPVLRRLPRLARELATSLGKDIDFSLAGDDSQVDKQIADSIFEPLLHLVRNAIDHGVEDPAGRVAAGKPPRGSVALSLAVEGDRLAVTLRDDGRGIDAERIRASALGKGLVEEAEAAALSDAQAQRLIFLPGFSTAAVVSTVSGRGVGMHAVLAAVERLQGTIDLDSAPGRGTSFRISLPLAAITTRLLTVRAGDGVYGLRLDQIAETLRLEAADLYTVGAGQACVVRDRTVPVLDLGALLGFAGEGEGTARLVVTEVTGEPIALRVKALGERLDALVREPSGLLARLSGIGGTSVQGDGSVLLVLDLMELLA